MRLGAMGLSHAVPCPRGWTKRRLRFLTRINKPAKINSPPETEVSFVPMAAIGENGGIQLDQIKPLDEIGDSYTPFVDGDVLVAKITPCFENGKGALAEGLKSGVAFGTTELHVVQAGQQIDRRFLFYLSISELFRELGEGAMYGAGGQKRVPELFIKDFQAPVPPLYTQEKIARFLDRKTAEIDTLIEKKGRLLDLLAEKRTALITRAVTKGMNPDAPMKDSGIEWVGEIPAHWDTRRIKFLLKEPLKYGANKSAEFDDPDWPRFIRITDLSSDGRLRRDTFRSIPPAEASNYLLEDGDILLARSGATVGKSFQYRSKWGRAAFAGYLIRARPNKRLNSSYFQLFFNSNPYWEWIKNIFIQSTIQNVSAEKYGSIMMPLPPIAEQHEIVDHLGAKNEQLDIAVITIQKAMRALEEYRSALITNAVTGQIKVV